ncbi:pentapeptide repeat-containing protein [Rhodococcus erythropolis]|uniref:pentapeptide repeat-containing protein n=1 Tax=Rhodococcus erythropolis TaxID=1833 RepID=UPI00398260D7
MSQSRILSPSSSRESTTGIGDNLFRRNRPASAETAAELLADRFSSYFVNPIPYEASRSHCTGADLTGMDLSGANLTHTNLGRSTLRPADITVDAEDTDGAHATWAIPSMPTGVQFGAFNYPSGALFLVGLTTVTSDVATSYPSKPGDSNGYFSVYVIAGLEWAEPPVTGSLAHWTRSSAADLPDRERYHCRRT